MIRTTDDDDGVVVVGYHHHPRRPRPLLRAAWCTLVDTLPASVA